VQFVVKTGTFSVIVAADRRSGDVHRMPIGTEALQRAAAYRLEIVLDGATRFARRGVVLALWLGGGYIAIGLAYVAAVTAGLNAGARWSWLPAWPLLVLVATAASAVLVTAVRLAYDLLRVVVVTDDCSVSVAARRLGAFTLADARQVIGIFVVMGCVQLLAGVVALLAAAGLAVVAYVPLVSLVFVPLQAAAWVLRGLLFESLALAALAAYETQYRRFSEARDPAVRP
jgi:hypothetical protein